MEAFFVKIGALLSAIPFSLATWFVLITLWFFIMLFAKASKHPDSLVNWEHLLLDSTTNRASVYKVSFIVGVIVSTWIIITFADGGKLTFDLFGVYLAFLLGGAGLNTFSRKSTLQMDNVDRLSAYTNPYQQSNVAYNPYNRQQQSDLAYLDDTEGLPKA